MRITYNPLSPTTVPSAPLYLISGDEPILMQACLNTIYAQYKTPVIKERTDNLSEDLFSITQQLSLFNLEDLENTEKSNNINNSKITIITIQLSTAKLTTEQSLWIENYSNNKSNNITNNNIINKIIIIITPKLEKNQQNQAWIKAIDASGIIFTIWPLYPSQYPKWIKNQASAYQLNLSEQAISLLSYYFEGNLHGLDNQLQILSLAYENNPIPINQLKTSLSLDTHFTPFDLIDAMLDGQCLRVLQIWQVLSQNKNNYNILILWALNQAFTKIHLILENTQPIEKIIFFPKQRPRYQQAARRLNRDYLKKQSAQLPAIDVLLKTGNLELGAAQLQLIISQISFYPKKNAI